MENILNFQFNNLFCYIFWAVMSAVAVRIFIAANVSWQRGRDWFFPVLFGCGKQEIGNDEPIAADYLLGLCIGIFELIAYPVFLKTNTNEFIGAWLVFKTANRWNYKQHDRGIFNRYLFSNALVLFFSYLLARFVL